MNSWLQSFLVAVNQDLSDHVKSYGIHLVDINIKSFDMYHEISCQTNPEPPSFE